MTSLNITTEYISAGANRHTATADWSYHGTLAFGSDVNIALWHPNAKVPQGVTCLLSGHKDVVKVVKFLPPMASPDSKEQLMITGSDDHSLKLWTINMAQDKYECIQTLTDHTAPIHVVAVLQSQTYSKGILLASGAADATIKVWKFDNKQLVLVQSINTAPRFFPLALALSSLDNSDDTILLSAAGTKAIIQVFVANISDSSTINFTLQSTLNGHEGWIWSLEFVRETENPSSDILMSSASQDKYIRIWRVHQGTELPGKPNSGANLLGTTYLPGQSLTNKAHKLVSGDKSFSITFEALLLGHEDWIYSAQWLTKPNEKPKLLSTSADNTLAIWEPDADSGIWISMVRLGEISREKGATTATGSTGGFWTGLWSPDGKSVVCLGRTGSWRRWSYDSSAKIWKQEIGVSGHIKAVTGIAWSRSGGYLLSTSSDQTTRLHAPWTGVGASDHEGTTWHEMARPQIHGYDLNCIGSLGDHQFVSGADEKLMRVFAEPKTVATLLNKLSGIDVYVESMLDAANMPMLGLSNKAVDTDTPTKETANAPETEPSVSVRKSALDISHPPFEDSLSRYTLFPEVEKLYGHGYEISCLTSSHDGSLIASACKATSTNHAVIRLFETNKWTEVKPPLVAHSLTAARVRFSRDNKYILSVGRDRQWAIFEKGETEYKLRQSNPKGHTRMILDAAWAECSNVRAFATAGRDKKVNLWVEKEGNFVLGTSVTYDSPVTAIDFLQFNDAKKQVLAVGIETGQIHICVVSFGDTTEMISNIGLDDKFCSSKSILQLSWQPATKPDSITYKLAVAGDDSSLRLYSVHI